MIVALLLSAIVFAQPKSVTKFLGIPIDGSKAEMIQKLKEKGYTYNSKLDCLEGEFNGRDVQISVVTNNSKVYRILVQDAIPSSEGAVPVLLYHDLPEDALLCPMIDARRMEVYAAVYDRRLQVKRAVAADIVDENSYLEFLNEQPVYFFGNGADKCREQITHPNAHFIDNIHPLAKMMFPLAEKAIADEDYKDVAYFEPFYLKEFVASMPKKLL